MCDNCTFVHSGWHKNIAQPHNSFKMVIPLHEETVSREEARYNKIHSLGCHLKARKNLNPVFEDMAAEAPVEIKVLACFVDSKKNKLKNYVPRRIP